MYSINKKEYDLLCIIRKNPGISTSMLSAKTSKHADIIHDYLHLLKSNWLLEIGINEANEQSYIITPLGLQALLDYKEISRNTFLAKLEDRFWKFAPLIISIFSLLKSYNFI